MTLEELKNNVLKIKKHSEKLSEEEKELEMAIKDNNIDNIEKNKEKISKKENINKEEFDKKIKIILDNPEITEQNKEKILKDLENIKTIENDDLISKMRVFGYNFVFNEDKNNFTEVNKNKEYSIDEIKNLYLNEYIKNLYEEFIKKTEKKENKDIGQDEKDKKETLKEQIKKNNLQKEKENEKEEIKVEKKDEVKKDITNIKDELENFNFINLDEDLIENKVLAGVILGILSKKNEMMKNLNEINIEIQAIEGIKKDINVNSLPEEEQKEFQKLQYEENSLKNKKNQALKNIEIFNNRAKEFLIKNMRLNQTKILKEKNYDETFKKYSLKAIESNTIVQYAENVEKLNNLERTMGFEVLMNFADNILKDLQDLNGKFEMLKESFLELIEKEAIKNNQKLEKEFKKNLEYKEQKDIDTTIKTKIKL